MKSSGQAILFDDMVDALADIRRRKLLVALLEHNPQDEPGVVGEEGEVEAAKKLLEMRHVHLPKLADYGLVIWDEEAHEVAKGPNFDEVRPLLELLDDHADELPPDWL